MSETTTKSKFQKWYETNRDALNQKRREKYKTDPHFRESMKESQRTYRQTHPTRSRAGETRFKEVNGRVQEVFRIGEVATQIGRDEQTIRGWEEKGVIPRPSVPGVHRNYTQGQIELMKELANLIDRLRYDKNLLQDAVASKSQEIHQLWSH